MKEFQALPGYWSKLLFESWPVKAGVAWSASLTALIFPNAAGRTAALAVVSLVVLDTLTGTVAARVTGEAVSSAKLRRAVVKLFGYFAAILAVALAFRILPGLQSTYEPAVSSVTSLIVLTEVLSVFENLKRLGCPLPEWILRLLVSKRDQISRGP